MFLLEPIQLGIRLVQLERQRRPVELEFALCPSAYWHLSIEDKLPPLLGLAWLATAHTESG